MSNTESIVALLKMTELFAPFGADDLAAGAALFREARFVAGQVLFSRGEAGTHLYLVAEGRVRLAVVTGDGRELSVRIAAPGDVIGEISTLDGGPRTADATALTAVRVFALAGAELDRLLAEHLSVVKVVIHFLCQRLRDTTDQLEAIALYPIEVRLARFLVFALGGKTAPAGKRIPLELGFSQGELAQLLGASRPKVNIALGVLEEAGAIKRTADRLFCDPALLAWIAEAIDG